MNITDEGALLVKVNRHKQNYDGSICIKPTTYECGANQWFRQNNCARNIGDCYDIKLFHETTPYIVKTISDEITPLFEKQMALIESGFNPIIFFYTFGRSRHDKSFPIVGAYIVDRIHLEKGLYKNDVYIYPLEVIKLPPDSLPNEYLYIRSTELPTVSWCREIYQSAVYSFLETMLSRLQDYDEENFIKSSQLLTKLLDGVTSPRLISDQPGDEKASSQNTPGVSQGTEENVVSIATSESNKESLVIIELKDKFDREVDQIVEMAAKSGFYYPRTLVASLHNSLTSNPFLILSGISGGGKTSFALFYAKALQAEIKVISVRPDWTSPSHLLGFYDPFAREFVPSETTRFINKASEAFKNNPDNPDQYILLLDEMNLARVEYYFSDFLSKMQVQDSEQRSIRLYDESEGTYPHELIIPPNLKIIGTVNIDETTFLFSPKVLDRATYILLNEIDIDGMGRVLTHRKQDFYHLDLMTEQVLPDLKVLNAKLAEFGNPFGYRTVWEIIRWIDSALAVGIIENVYEGLDLQVESRVLSKMTGIRRDGLFQGLMTYFQDRTDATRAGISIFQRSLTRLENLMERAEREEYVIGQQ